MLSSVVSQSYLAENEVFLTDYLSNIGREQIHGIKCIIFIRPTTANMELLMRELREPRYSEYHICK